MEESLDYFAHLKFDQKEYMNELGKIIGRNIYDGKDWFNKFVSMTLHSRGPSDLLEFHISWPRQRHEDCESIRSWIDDVLKLKPKVMYIRVSSSDAIPVDVFNCPSLENLSLSVKFRCPSASGIDLPCLKQLHLRRMFLNKNFAEKLFHGCPVLERLHLEECDLRFSIIESQSLKYLHLGSTCFSSCKTIALEFVNAPNLLSFYYQGCPNYIGHKNIMNLPSLTDATVCVSDCSDYQFCKGECNFFCGISNVQNLKLMGSEIKDILKKELPKCPEFPNTKDLNVENLCLNCHFDLLVSLLDHFPNLENLSLLHCGCDCKLYKEHGNQELLKVAPFLCNQLKRVEVQFCKHDKYFSRVMKYLQDGVHMLRAEICTSTFPSDVDFYEYLCCQHRSLLSLVGRCCALVDRIYRSNSD